MNHRCSAWVAACAGLLCGLSGSLAAGASAPPAPRPAPRFDEAKAFELLRLEELRRFDNLCGEVPAHYPPADPNPPFDVTHYDLVIDLRPDVQRIRQSTGITATVLHDSLDSIALDYCGPQVQRVFELGVNQVRPFTRQDDQLIVSLSRVRHRGESFTIVVDDSGATPGGGVIGIRWAPPQYPESPSTFTFSEPEGARFWFPCHDVPGDKATVGMLISVPSDHVVAGNGRLAADYEDVFQGRPRRIFWWVEDEPIATYLVAFAAAPYAVLHDDRLPSVPIVNYVYRPDSVTARQSFDRVPDMIRYFSQLFGDYPFQKYGHAAALFGGGMEHQTMTLITERAAMDSANYQWLMAHELAHQWWGDAVTLGDWRHMWLNEGFATYGDALWHEHEFGAEGLRARMALFGGFYIDAYAAGQTGPVVDPLGTELFGHASYEKGAWVLHMLRHIVGDATFFRILRTYQAAHRYGNAVTQDFVAAAESVSGRDLGWFFDPWLYRRGGYPRYRWGFEADTLASGQALVRITVAQTQDTTFYAMPVDFAFRTPAGVRRESVFLDRNPQTFTVLLDAPPTEVAFDPESWILSTVEPSAIVPVSSELSRLSSVRVLSNPGRPPLDIELRLTPGEPVAASAEILDVQGRRVATPFRGLAATGTLHIKWSGATDDGRAARPGVYFARVVVGNVIRTVRLVLVL